MGRGFRWDGTKRSTCLHDSIDTLKGDAIYIIEMWFNESQMIYLTGGHSLKRGEKNPLEAIFSVLRGSCQPFSSHTDQWSWDSKLPELLCTETLWRWQTALVLVTLMMVNESVRTSILKKARYQLCHMPQKCC